MLKPATQNIIDSLAQFGITLPNTSANTINFMGMSGNIQNDSRKVVEGDIFCAIIGHDQDGRQYIDKAIEKGAKLVVAECESSAEHGDVVIASGLNNIAVVKFYNLNNQLFSLTKYYYQSPQDNMTIVGVTGTNGKTTTSQLLAQMLNGIQKPCAVIGTNGAGSLDNLYPIENTTPGACELHQLLNFFNIEQFNYAAMEVSSHALEQKRVKADLFNIAIFTNLSRDHLDYHGSMESYGEAKKKIFTGNNNQIAIVNFDDAQGKKWLENWPAEQVLWLYGREDKVKTNQYYVSAADINHHNQGVSFTLASHLGTVDITSPLLGDFNIDNLLAAISVLLIQGVSLNEIPDLVSKVSAIAGRMEAYSAQSLATAVVDYAHTPDALEKSLQACRQHCDGDLYVVFGCGGDRDKGKRPLMAQAAEKYADHIVVTNDNPRRENAQLIANDILAGFTSTCAQQVSVILEREEAVITTLNKAKPNDIVLLAGKGHEDYVIVGKADNNGDITGVEKLPYNERLIVDVFYQNNVALDTTHTKASL